MASNVEPGEPRVFLTLAGLANPGSTARCEVYVTTTDGNESGSNAVTVSRPGED